jgi:hypothetical protein
MNPSIREIRFLRETDGLETKDWEQIRVGRHNGICLPESEADIEAYVRLGEGKG